MPSQIPEMIKIQVIRQWLQGLSRDCIAHDNNISTGAVSNIIDEWMNALGRPKADSLRELAKSLKIEGITPAECASGFRTMKLLSGLNITRETVEHFVTDVIKGCENIGITASKALTHIEDLVKFSDHVRLPEIKDNLNQKIAEKRQLETEVQELEDKKSTLKKEVSETEKKRNVILEQKTKAAQEMSSYFSAEQILDKHNISMKEFQKFANTVKCIAEYGYSPEAVLAEFKGIQYLSGKRRELEIATDNQEKDLAKLSQQDYLLRHHINLYSEKLSVYNELANIGVGPKELRVLYNLIVNITNSNGIDYWLAAGKFFNDIGTQYDPKLGFESKIEELKSKSEILRDEREKDMQRLKNQHIVGPIVTQLLIVGLTQNDILTMAKLYLSLLNGTYSAEDLTKGMIKTIDMMAASSTTTTTTSHIKQTNNDKVTETLIKVRQDLSQLDL
jgi:hypothetical protein